MKKRFSLIKNYKFSLTTANRSGLMLFFIFINFTVLFAQSEYEWVIPGSSELSSSFGEYRAGHFHAGIDFRTPEGTGMKIVTPCDGSVVRVKVSPWGYGKVVYYKCDGDFITVFAHLSAFSDRITERIRQEQYGKEDYCVDLHFKSGELPFAKGQLLAKSGDTGAGSPHLHFETRHGMNTVVNPMIHGYTVADRYQPKIFGLMVIPKSYDSYIWRGNSAGGDDALGYIEFEPSKIEPGLYEVRRPIVVSGEIGLAIKSFDYQHVGNKNRMGFFQLSLFEEENLLYFAQYDSFDYKDTRDIGHVFDLYSEDFGSDRYHKMFHNYYVNAAPFQANDNNDGIVTLMPGELKEYRAVVLDPNGNKSVLRFWLKGAVTPQISEFRLSRHDWGAAIHYNFDIDSNTIKLDLSPDGGNTFNDIPIRYGKDYISYRSQSSDIARLRMFSSSDTLNAIKRKFYFLTPAFSSFDSTELRSAKIEDRFFADDNFLFIELTSVQELCFPERINLDDGATFFDLETPSTKSLRLRIPMSQLEEGSHSLRIAFADQRVFAKNFEIFEINKSGESYTGNELQITFPKNALYPQSAKFAFSVDYVDSVMVYSIVPAGMIFKRNVDIAIKIPQSSEIDSVLSISKSRAYLARFWNGNIYFTGNDTLNKDINVNWDYISGSVSTPGQFAFAIDTIPPEVKVTGFFKNKIVFSLNDKQSGFSNDYLPSCYIDSSWTLCEYDPDKDRCEIYPKNSLASGSHNLKIEISDKCGNTTVIDRTFSIK